MRLYAILPSPYGSIDISSVATLGKTSRYAFGGCNLLNWSIDLIYGFGLDKVEWMCHIQLGMGK